MPHENPEADPLEARDAASAPHAGADHAAAVAAGSLTLDPALAQRGIRAEFASVQQMFESMNTMPLSPWEQAAAWERIVARLLQAKSLAMQARNHVADQLIEPTPHEDFSDALKPGVHPVKGIAHGGPMADLAAGLLGFPSTHIPQRSA